MRTLWVWAVLLCALAPAAQSRLHAAGKDAGAKTTGNDPTSAAQAAESIRVALRSTVEPAFEAAKSEQLKKVGVVVVPAQQTAVDRRLASIVQGRLDDLFPRNAKKQDGEVEWDVSGETHAALLARQKAAASARPTNRKPARGEPAPPVTEAPPDLTCDGILAVTCRMKGAEAAIDFALLRAPGKTASAKDAPPARQRRQDPGKPLWKGTAKLARSDLAALPAVPDLNVKVLAFAREYVGQQVGNGECWTLAAEALQAAGAKPAAGYVFGRELRPGEEALPGDVMQFTSVRLEHKGGGWETLGTPNHTAVVAGVSGQVYDVLHQNMGGVRRVVAANVNLADKTEGTVKIYRPVTPGGR
jgi:hypothetical protein